DSELKPNGQVLLHPHAQIAFTHRGQYKVKRTHFAAIAGAAPNDVRRRGQQFHVSGASIAKGEKDRLWPSDRAFDALKAARCLRARGQEAEAHAALLLTVADERGRPRIARKQPGPEDAVADQLQQRGMHLADDGATVECQISARARAV